MLFVYRLTVDSGTLSRLSSMYQQMNRILFCELPIYRYRVPRYPDDNLPSRTHHVPADLIRTAGYPASVAQSLARFPMRIFDRRRFCARRMK
jgi:hypothetical protein